MKFIDERERTVVEGKESFESTWIDWVDCVCCRHKQMKWMCMWHLTHSNSHRTIQHSLTNANLFVVIQNSNTKRPIQSMVNWIRYKNEMFDRYMSTWVNMYSILHMHFLYIWKFEIVDADFKWDDILYGRSLWEWRPTRTHDNLIQHLKDWFTFFNNHRQLPFIDAVKIKWNVRTQKHMTLLRFLMSRPNFSIYYYCCHYISDIHAIYIRTFIFVACRSVFFALSLSSQSKDARLLATTYLVGILVY